MGPLARTGPRSEAPREQGRQPTVVWAAAMRRDSPRSAGTTAMGGFRKERPRSPGAIYLTPRGTTGKVLQSLVSPLHRQIFMIQFEKK